MFSYPCLCLCLGMGRGQKRPLDEVDAARAAQPSRIGFVPSTPSASLCACMRVSVGVRKCHVTQRNAVTHRAL